MAKVRTRSTGPGYSHRLRGALNSLADAMRGSKHGVVSVQNISDLLASLDRPRPKLLKTYPIKVDGQVHQVKVYAPAYMKPAEE